MTTGGAQSNWSEGKRLSEEHERGTIAALVALGGLVRRGGVGKLLLATLEKSYKSYLRGYLASKIKRFSEIDCHRSAFWGTSQNATAES